MSHLFASHKRLAFAALAVVACLAATAPAQSPLEKIDTSIQWIPADAALYSSTLRLGEQVEIIGKSRAWAEIKAMPIVKLGMQQLREQLDSNEKGQQVKAVLQNPETRKALELLGDMFSNEVFIYGDASLVDFIEVAQRVNAATSYGPMVAGLKPGSHSEKLLASMLISTLADHVEKIGAPNVVIGFKLTNRDHGVEALAKLEGLINLATIAAPKMAERIARTKVAGHEYLTITLDGAMIPWDQVPLELFKASEEREGDIDKLVERVKKQKLVIALGLRKDYLLLAVGSSTDIVARLGTGSNLTTVAELKPLEAYADRRLSSIAYMNKAMAGRVLDNVRGMEDALDAVKKALPKTELSDEEKAQIVKDAEELLKDLRAAAPKPGAYVEFSFLTDRGVEDYTYIQTRLPHAPGDGPMSIAEHLGGSPILAIAARGRLTAEPWDLAVKWFKVGKRYVDKYAVPKMDDDAREKYQQAEKLFTPLLEQWNETTRSKLIPSLSPGQGGIVLDARLKSKQFCKEMPLMKEPMPMIEPAVVLAISKPEQLREALSSYRKLINQGIAAAHKINPEVPEFELPEPKQSQSGDVALFTYPAPKDWGLTEEIELTLGLSSDTAVIAGSRGHAQRLLKPTPLRPVGLLAESDSRRVSAVMFDWAALVDAATPWVEYAAEKAIEANGPTAKKPPAKKAPAKKSPSKRPAKEALGMVSMAADDPLDDDGPAAPVPKPLKKAKPKGADKAGAPMFDKDQIMAQVRTVLKVLKVLRTVTVESRVEGDMVVTHSLIEIKDIE